MIKGFTGEKWFKQQNPAFRESCFRKASQELVDLKIGFDFFIKRTNKQ
mgnify:CR=1 FL=1